MTVYLAPDPGRCVHEVILVVFPYSVVIGINWDSAVEEPECPQLSLRPFGAQTHVMGA